MGADSLQFTTVQEEVLSPAQRIKFFKGVVAEGQTIAQVVDMISKGTIVVHNAEEQQQVDATKDFLNSVVPAGKELLMVVQIALQLVNSNQPSPNIDPGV